MKDKIVIIGGMGPQASIHFHRMLIDYYANKGAVANADYPQILHLSIPVKDFISSEDSAQALKMIKSTLSSVSFTYGDKLFLTCNTAHVLIEDLEQITGVKIVSLIDEVVRYVDSNLSRKAKLGIIASPSTIKNGLYSTPLLSLGYKVIAPGDRAMHIAEQSIRGVIANDDPYKYADPIRKVLENQYGNEVEKIILGCTELSLIFSKNVGDERLLDPLKIVIESNLQ